MPRCQVNLTTGRQTGLCPQSPSPGLGNAGCGRTGRELQDGRRGVGLLFEMLEDFLDHDRMVDACDGLHRASTVFASGERSKQAPSGLTSAAYAKKLTEIGNPGREP